MKVAPDNVAKLNAIARDFRTDTITVPTEEMFEAMRIASRGDDVYGVSRGLKLLERLGVGE